MFTSSSEKETGHTMTTATLPYSGNDFELAATSSIVVQNAGSLKALKAGMGADLNAQDPTPSIAITKQMQPQTQQTVHPFLYEPWKLLPCGILNLFESHVRLRILQKAVPVVFTKNQNLKSGINRLKAYLGAYRDPTSTMELPDSLWQEDCVIAISAQGDGTTKLIGIVDMVKRIVAPSEKDKNGGAHVEMWWIYTTLGGIEIDWSLRTKDGKIKKVGDETGETQKIEDEEEKGEEESFESMEIDGKENQDREEADQSNVIRKRTIPVLTVWVSRKQIPELKQTFGEQSITVQKMQQDNEREKVRQ